MKANPKPRFRAEVRAGIVVVADSEHPEYGDSPCRFGDEPWCIATWWGYRVDGPAGYYWEIEQWKIDKAQALAERLNEMEGRNQDDKED